MRGYIYSIAACVAYSLVLNDQDRPAAALKMLSDYIKRDPKQMNNLINANRYNLACYSARAGTGQGEDAPPESEWPSLRRKSLAWLNDDLELWQSYSKFKNNKQLLHNKMNYWLNDTDLANVRDGEKLKLLPAEERKLWEQLWADVCKLRDETSQ